MGLGINYNQISSIDVNSLKEVTGKIFSRANQKSDALENFDLSKFNRVSQGTDLYGNGVTASQASQIAMMNAGLNIQLNTNTLNSLKYLNNQASKKALADVTGNIAFPVEAEKENKSQAAKLSTFGKLVSISNLALDNKQA